MQMMVTFLLNALLSAVIGLIIGIALMFIYPIENLLSHLATSAFIGIIIGTVARFSAVILFRGLKNTYWCYIHTFIITLFGVILSGYLFETPLISISTLVILAIAQPLALLVAFLNIKYSCRLNEGLKRKQALLSKKIK